VIAGFERPIAAQSLPRAVGSAQHHVHHQLLGMREIAAGKPGSGLT
jgi:hypothetical protein